MFPGGYAPGWCRGEPSTCLLLWGLCQAEELLAVLSAAGRVLSIAFYPVLFENSIFFFTSPLGKAPKP